MSWPTQMTPIMSPWELNRAVALSNKHTGRAELWLVLAESSTSKLDVGLPLKDV